MVEKRKHNSAGEGKITPYRIFSIFNTIIMLFIILITAYPVYYIVVASFSDAGALSRHVGMLWLPLKPYTLSAYRSEERRVGKECM